MTEHELRRVLDAIGSVPVRFAACQSMEAGDDIEETVSLIIESILTQAFRSRECRGLDLLGLSPLVRPTLRDWVADQFLMEHM